MTEHQTGSQEIKENDWNREKLATEWGFPIQADVYLSPLAAAAIVYNLDEVQRLLGLGADPNYRDKMALTVLTAALLRGSQRSKNLEQRYQVIKLLLENGADPNQGVLDDEKHLEYLGSTPLIMTSGGPEARPNIEIVKLLLEHGADPNLCRSDNGKTLFADGSSPLLFALGRGGHRPNLEIAKLLLEHGADPNLKSSDNGLSAASLGMSPLVCAIAAEPILPDLEIVRVLLEHGADPNLGVSDNGLTPGSNGMRPLDFAVGAGEGPANLKLTKLLLEHGADPNLAKNSKNPNSFVGGANALEIHIMLGAQSERSTEFADFLLKKGAILNDAFIFGGQIEGLAGHSLLSFAVSQGSVTWVKWLLDHKVDPNIVTEHGSLLEVARNGSNAKIAALLGRFSVMGAINVLLKKPKMIALLKNHSVDKLKNHGVDKSAKTPLLSKRSKQSDNAPL